MSENEQEADVETEAEDASADAEGIQDGDFVRLAYTLRTVDDSRVIDTTDKEVAEENDLDTEQYEFEPRVIVIGAGHVFEAVDEDIKGKDVGDDDTVEIPAEEAFGGYDPDQVRTISAEKIPEDDRYPGAHVTIDGESGHVETVIGGRSRVDFNHPLAGEDLEYEYEILEVVEDREQQAEGLLGMHLQQAPELWISTDEVEEEQIVESEETDDAEDDEDEEAEPETELVTVEKETLYIEATPQMTMNQQWMFQKQQIAQDLMDRLDLDRVIVQETIEGMGGMMGGMGGMMGGGLEEALEDVDVDADELVEELEGEGLEDVDLEGEEIDAEATGDEE